MPETHVPYSNRGLESLAAALNVDTALLWVSPNTNQLSIREGTFPQQIMQSNGLCLGKEENNK